MNRNRILALLVPLAVVFNRLLIYVGLFYNDFAVAILAGVIFASYRLRLPLRSLRYVSVLFLLLAGHCSLFAIFHPDLQLTILFNFARMVACLLELIAFYTFYSNISAQEATTGLRRAAWVLSGSVIVHFVLLNCAGDFGRSLGTWQEHELAGRAYDLATVGFLRPRGIAMEPAFAAGYLFLMGAFLLLIEPRGKSMASQAAFLISALLTGSLSMILFLPLWAYLLFRSAKRRQAALATAVVVLPVASFFLAGSTQASMISGRAWSIVRGEDLSASLRLVPMLRTITGTLEEAPWSGFGIGQSRLADSAGAKHWTLNWLPEVESELYSGIVAAEVFGDFGIPGLLAFAALFHFCALPKRRLAASWWWLACILITQNCYVYRNPQLYYWFSLGMVLARPHEGARQPIRSAFSHLFRLARPRPTFGVSQDFGGSSARAY